MKIENRGGKRDGAGRKSKASEQKLIERLDRIIDEDEVLQVLKQLIKDGDLRAVQLYLSYRRGKPKDTIENFWTNKSVRFAYLNNCIGCFHRSPILLKHMSNKHPEKYQWFVDAEEDGYGARTFKNGMSYKQIRNSLTQVKLFDNDFNDCDSGYCGV